MVRRGSAPRGWGGRRRGGGGNRAAATTTTTHDSLSHLPVHRPRSVLCGHAPRAPGPVPLHCVVAEGLPVPPRDPDDGRREVHLQGGVRRRTRGRRHGSGAQSHRRQPRSIRQPHDRECQGHRRVRIPGGQDLPILGPQLRGADVPQHCAHLEGRHRQSGQRNLRLRRRIEHRQDRLPGRAGRTVLRQLLPQRAGRRRLRRGHARVPHPLRHRPGSVLSAHPRHRP
mmetsp:Transcript_22874/g.43165  ORF Transcript_22874/g.43165 Transcript_22874/m.43165 type:complete len:226 (+) Transcript_22874:656-1333(+)